MCDKTLIKEEWKLMFKRFIKNLAVNLLVIIPAVLYLLPMHFVGERMHNSGVVYYCMMALYPFAMTAALSMINTRYCRRNGIKCYVQWWAVMLAVEYIVYAIGYVWEVYALDIPKSGLVPTIMWLACIVLTSIAAVVSQVVLLLCGKKDEQEAAK